MPQWPRPIPYRPSRTPWPTWNAAARCCSTWALAEHALGREGDRHGRPLPGHALDVQLAAVQLDQALGQRQAEAGSLVAPGQGAVALAAPAQRHDKRFATPARTGIGE